MRPARLVRLGMQGIIYWTGASYVMCKVCPSGAVILMYHSVADKDDAREIDPRNRINPAKFTQQMEFLAKYRRVISISELASCLEAGRPLKTGSVVLTFDDGYRDNLEVAAPILKRLGLPAIIYLPTALISSGDKPWVDHLYSMFGSRRRHTLDGMNGETSRFDLDSRDDCRAAFAHTSALLIAAKPSAREEILATVKKQLEPNTDESTRPLNWDQLRGMRADFPLVEIGLHSESHIDLTAQEPDVVRRELRQCIATCKSELGVVPKHFAYPYNRHNDEVRRLVAEHGFQTAVSCSDRCEINQSADLLVLPRLAVPHSMTLFRLWTQGAACSLRLANRS